MSHERAVLLDVDGTLIDSNDAHARAWVDAFAEDGFAVAFDAVRPLIGMGGDKLIPAAIGLADDDPRIEGLSERRGRIFKERYQPAVCALPGSRALVERLRTEGYRVAVASSAKSDELGPLLEIARVNGLIDVETSSSDADRSKPDPDIVGAALRRLDIGADAAVMIGDTPYDIEAARRAGVPTVAFRSGGWSDEKLAGAVAIFDGPADLLTRFDTSPLAARRMLPRR
jgi:HAD superfamily hydrolase (TIGR01509 family)